MAVRYTPGELAKVEAAAAREGLVTAAWLGEAGLVLADPAPADRGAARASREELDCLVQATEKVRRVGFLFNQVVATMHATGRVSPAVEHVAVRVWQKVAELDDATMAIVPRRKARRR